MLDVQILYSKKPPFSVIGLIGRILRIISLLDFNDLGMRMEEVIKKRNTLPIRISGFSNRFVFSFWKDWKLILTNYFCCIEIFVPIT